MVYVYLYTPTKKNESNLCNRETMNYIKGKMQVAEQYVSVFKQVKNV